MTESWDGTPEALRAFIAAEKACPDPSVEAQDRVFARLVSTVGVVPGPPSMPSSPVAPAAPAGVGALSRVARGLSRRGVATFLVGAALGGAAVRTIDHVRSTRPTESMLVSPAQVLPAPIAPAATAEPDARPVPSMPSAPLPVVRRVSSPPSSAGGAKDKRLEAERKLVEMARTALARGQTAGALVALRRHQRGFPEGALAEERDSLWVTALVAAGEHTQAREHAARFHRRYPHSLFVAAVDQALQSIP